MNVLYEIACFMRAQKKEENAWYNVNEISLCFMELIVAIFVVHSDRKI